MRIWTCFAFLLASAPALAEDVRTPLALSADDIAAVRQEMRDFLAGVQQISAALAKHDMKGVAGAAIELGRPGNSPVPMATRMKFPMEFKAMGRATHTGFYNLATDAEAVGDTEHSLKQLGDTLQQCVACHATYRLVEQKP